MEDYRLEQSGQEVQDILNGAAMQVDLTEETERATEAEQTLQGNIDAEATRAQDAEGTLQDNIDAEEARAKAAEKQNADDIDAIEEKIPSGASSSNKLATEEYVDDAVATATATFRGTYNLVSDLHLNVTATEQQIAAALAGAISTADNNDYCFIQVPTSSETPTEIKEIDRYKFNGTAWAFEYKLNNSGFTAAQWAAINSGITSGDVAKLAALPTNAQLTTLLAGLQSDIDGEETRAKAAELALQGNIDAEEARAKAAEKQNADDIDAIESVIPESASSENKVATKSEIDSLSAAIEAILLLIPSAATSLNKLADKAFVNSSIATATATFRGTYNLVDDLGLTISATHAQIATALAGAILTADNNDYAFVQIPTSDAMPTEIAKTERYKFNGTAWEYEYDLNNSGFTADQWAAINSGITQALVTKLAALPTNTQLTTELGTLTSGITAINQKIPNAASQANKLVDTAAMESYIVQVLDVLTISYNVTSTDGHVTLSIEQVDGKITSVALTTSDIASAAALNLKASQADLTALASRVTTAEGNITSLGGRMTTAEGNITSLGERMTTAESNITSLGGRVSTNETDIANLQQLYNNLQQSKPVPVTALPSTGQQQGVIYRLAGTTSYSDYMWNGSTWVLMATYNNAIDSRPKKASQNLVTSGGVFDNMGALDVSELNATENPHTLAQYVDLPAALAAIPTDYQKGGMSIKFVQSSDNKYVQYRFLLSGSFTDAQFTNPDNWQGIDDVPTAGSDNLVKSGGVAKQYNSFFAKDTYDGDDFIQGYARANEIGETVALFKVSGYSYIQIPIFAGKEVDAYFNANYQNLPYFRCWIVTDINGVVKSFSTETADYRINPLILEPEVDGYFYISGADAHTSFADASILVTTNKMIVDEEIDEIEEHVETIEKDIAYKYQVPSSDFEEGYYYGSSSDAVGSVVPLKRADGYYCTKLPIFSGCKVTVKLKLTGNIPYYRPWYIVDNDMKIISMAETAPLDYKTNEWVFVAANNGYLLLNYTSDYAEYNIGGYALSISNRKDWDVKIEEIENEIDYKINIIIPDVVFAMPDTTLRVWNDAISLSVDRGLTSPINYNVEWYCQKGKITERGFEFTPSNNDVGDVQCTCNVYDYKFKLLATKTFTIRTIAKDVLSSTKRTLFVGDSLGRNTAEQLYNKFRDNTKYSGTIPQMVGSVGDTYKCEAEGGYSWWNYATAGDIAWRIYFSGVTSLEVGAVYKDSNDKYFTIKEVNINESTGNALLIRNPNGYGNLTIPDGTLTKYSGGGDSSISYTNAYQTTANPFWNNGALDFAAYRESIGLAANEKIDAVFFQLGINSNETDIQMLAYIRALYDAFISDNPNGIFVVGIIPSSGNTTDGSGLNNGATLQTIEYHKRIYNRNNIYLDLINDATRPNIRISAQGLFVDRYYGYELSSPRKVYPELDNMEQVHINYVHPGSIGYSQLADCLLATYIGVLTE